MNRANRTWRSAILVFAILIAATAIGAGLAYPGSSGIYVFFSLAFAILAALMFPRPRLYVYTFLALLLVLGFWMKTVVQCMWAPGFVEPVGAFEGTPDSWDMALLVAAWGALGAALPRLFHILLARARPGAKQDPPGGVPLWFIRFRRLVWAGTVFLVLGINLANFHYAFFQVGANSRLILPAHLNVLIAWLINTGFALWLATLVLWEFRLDDRHWLRSLQVPVLEAFLSSVSALSRLLLLLHLIPYAFAIAENWNRFGASIGRRTLVVAVWTFGATVVVSLSAVFLLRIMMYEEISRIMKSDSLGQYYQEALFSQVPRLFVHRWVGLEGVLSVSTAAERGRDVFLSVLREDPKRGADSVFQRVARTHYLAEDPRTNTYLSNAGITAILAFSGSLTVVFFGMVVTMILLVVTELCAQSLTGNPLFVAMAAAGTANVISQVTFPYLTGIYLLQLWVAIVFIHVLQKTASPTPTPLADLAR